VKSDACVRNQTQTGERRQEIGIVGGNDDVTGQRETHAGADRCADYLTNKAPYLDYATALERGWPIATGVIEGACRHLVKDRMDRTGARWGLDGAEAVLRLRAEETSGLAEPLLAAAVSRTRWGLSHVAVAVFGTAVLLALGGLATGLGYGLRAGSAGQQAARMIGAAMAQLPASLVIAGVAVALVGLLPGASVAGAWTVLGLVVVVDLFGQVLQLSHWALDVSPFTHAPKLPGGTVHAAPLLWLCLAALAFTVVGLAALRRRDIG